MLSWIFAFVHLILFVGLLFYSIFLLLTGHWMSGIILLSFLLIYYFIVLHPAVRKEIKRKRKSDKKKKI